ncbi:MAG: phage holin family protein [Candidatus Delongbacteria bacterium]|nr:phage holin family protein [Candidatus Delongbacteria bacterium]
MKRILRHYALDTFSLWVISNIAKGIIFEKGIVTLLISGIALTAVFFFAKPVINLLLLPLNLVTFGLFRWVSSAVVLYLVTLIIKEFKIVTFSFSGFTSKWIDIPSITLNGALAFIAFAFLLSLITSFLYWLMK